jgi:hypothetical protein
MARDDAQFSIIYDGEAVDEGSIDAKELAPALLALAEVIEEAQPLIPELDARISLRVRSDFERGSFEIHLEIAKLYQQFRELFSGQDASAFANLFQILGIAGVVGLAGLFQLIKKSKGRKTSSVTIERSERVKITFEGDDEPVEADPRTWQLFQNLRVRKAIEQVIAPLFHKGIDSFEIKHRGRQTVKVTEDEAKYFVAPTEHEGEIVTEVDTRVSLVAPSFQQGNKWRVSDGSRTIFVSVEDPAFVRAVQTGQEAFRKGDILQVRLQTRQWVEGGDLKAEHSIVKVLNHEPGPRNLSLLPDQDRDREPQ